MKRERKPLPPPEQAWNELLPHARLLGPEIVSRREALGRVLAAPLAATVDVPGTDVSAMDGYAVAGEVPAGEALPVSGTVAAGDPPGLRLKAGQAARIMTGATLPAGADRVIPVEQSDGGAERVIFTAVTPAGAHIRRRGEVLGTGDPVLAPGTPLTPGGLSLLATHGIDRVSVYRAPRVAVLTTGDEVIPPDREPRPGQLRDSNTDFLLAAGRSLGLDFHSLGIAGDDPKELRRHIEQGLDYDVLLLCGGVSMGEFDYVEDVLAELGVEAIFDAVAIQPGKPLVAAVHGGGSEVDEGGRGGLVFGLPGNPASVMVGFWLFVRPALRRMMGYSDGFWHGALAGELAGPLPAAKGRDRFLPAVVAFGRGSRGEPTVLARPISPRGSHDLGAYGRGSALVRVRAGSPDAAPGDPCELLPLADWRVEGLSAPPQPPQA